MSPPPARPMIYHITHINNLASIINDGRLLSDAIMIARGGPSMVIGMSAIKKLRQTLPVSCHPHDKVGEYVPFYFCPRSVMLFLIYRGNHPDLAYRDGQGPVLHLEADLHNVVAWATRVSRRWAFSLVNAGARYTPFRSNLAELNQINWDAVAATDWQAPDIKEAKLAEFLVYESFPWDLVSRIGVISAGMMRRVHAVLPGAAHRPPVQVQRGWYY